MDFEKQIRDELFLSETCAVLLGILIPPLLILWISSLYLVRREDDPARMAFTYLKMVYPMALLTLTFRFIHVMAMKKTLVSVSDETPPDEFLPFMTFIIDHSDALSVTLLDVTDVFLIITLFELGNGFLICLTAKRSSFYLVVQYIILVPSAAVLSLIITTFIQDLSIWKKPLSMDEDSEQRILEYLEERDGWDTALLILWGVASLVLVAYACFVSNKARDKPLILDSTVIFLGTTVLNLLNPGRQFLMIILDLDQDGWNTTMQYFYLIDNILDHWVRFFIIALIFVLGLRKDNGLWTPLSRLPGDLVPIKG
ncbi:hypothetical protein F53441_13354 [Fusarium austroafricanum]|uniref:Uncharacterized protein n=1 Tax=Fusarium austroafricanum TaxID=2364996 RepID=A0A8H4NI71_9HYPO|nr:hypothetical protein F53441_13354 [Fusarium austroafricanum]